ncbi:hypothetical protein EDB85DRAFT_2233800 [Lactarius pseudohatsudake]|nr:hypothetical protein EDB85DRAFT_2233800 [Lactarius pseudohatsudake]
MAYNVERLIAMHQKVYPGDLLRSLSIPWTPLCGACKMVRSECDSQNRRAFLSVMRERGGVFPRATANKPVPSVSGEGGPKYILIFHCKFSAKRAPTFAKHLRSKDRSINNHSYARVHFPEVYILEGGYCQYFKESGARYLNQFRKAKFGRTMSYAYHAAYGDAMGNTALKASKRNPGAVQPLFAAMGVAHSHREINDNGLRAVPEDPYILPSEDEETDIGDSP